MFERLGRPVNNVSETQKKPNHPKLNMKTTSESHRVNNESTNGSKGPGKSRVTPGAAKVRAPDLTKRPPRSPRTRLGGYSIFPRALDKGRATLGGLHGEYHFNCPLDQRFFSFVGIDAKKLLAELKKGKGDGEILNWIQANAKYTGPP